MVLRHYSISAKDECFFFPPDNQGQQQVQQTQQQPQHQQQQPQQQNIISGIEAQKSQLEQITVSGVNTMYSQPFRQPLPPGTVINRPVMQQQRLLTPQQQQLLMQRSPLLQQQRILDPRLQRTIGFPAQQQQTININQLANAARLNNPQNVLRAPVDSYPVNQLNQHQQAVQFNGKLKYFNVLKYFFLI